MSCRGRLAAGTHLRKVAVRRRPADTEMLSAVWFAGAVPPRSPHRAKAGSRSSRFAASRCNGFAWCNASGHGSMDSSGRGLRPVGLSGSDLCKPHRRVLQIFPGNGTPIVYADCVLVVAAVHKVCRTKLRWSRSEADPGSGTRSRRRCNFASASSAAGSSVPGRPMARGPGRSEMVPSERTRQASVIDSRADEPAIAQSPSGRTSPEDRCGSILDEDLPTGSVRDGPI